MPKLLLVVLQYSSGTFTHTTLDSTKNASNHPHNLQSTARVAHVHHSSSPYQLPGIHFTGWQKRRSKVCCSSGVHRKHLVVATCWIIYATTAPTRLYAGGDISSLAVITRTAKLNHFYPTAHGTTEAPYHTISEARCITNT